MRRPVHFEIHASDPDTLRAFYETVFGWTFQQWGEQEYWLAMTGDDPAGINGGLLRRQGDSPAPDAAVSGFVCTMDVPDCTEYVDKVVAAGGSVAVPRQAMAGMGWLAYVKDPDGNLFGLMQEDPSAA